MAKREISSKNSFVIAAIYGVCAAVWLAVGFVGNDYAFLLALVWAAMTAMWVASGIQQRQLEDRRSRPAAPDPVRSAPAQAPLGSLAQSEQAAAELHRLGSAMQNPAVRARTERLEATTRKILAQVVLHPEKQTQVRQFLDYYLPTSVKVLNAYSRMEASGGTQVQTLRERIEGMLGDLCAAFDRQLDALLRDEALDISADLTVMEQMLRQEGVGGMTMGGAR